MRSMTDLVLLGAGASVEAGVPASLETERLVERIADRHYSNQSQALNFVCGALVAYDATEGTSPYTGLDAERVFAVVRLLAEHRTLEVSPL